MFFLWLDILNSFSCLNAQKKNTMPLTPEAQTLLNNSNDQRIYYFHVSIVGKAYVIHKASQETVSQGYYNMKY